MAASTGTTAHSVRTRPYDWSSVGERYAPRQRAGVREYEVEGEVVLFNPDTQSTHLLNATALTVWRFCDGAVSMSELARRVALAYRLDLRTAADDVEQVITCLGGAGLLATESWRDS